MRFTRTTQLAWIAVATLALTPAAALAADSSSPESQLDSALDKTKEKAGAAWLTTKVKAALLADTGTSGIDVHVETTNGVVTLTGTVESEVVKSNAERIARSIDGVHSVRNELTVGAASMPGVQTGAYSAAGAPPMSTAQPMTVKATQVALKAQGHDPGPIDGILGPRTEAALREYQRNNGLPVTGHPDRPTLAQLGVQDRGKRQAP